MLIDILESEKSFCPKMISTLFCVKSYAAKLLDGGDYVDTVYMFVIFYLPHDNVLMLTGQSQFNAGSNLVRLRAKEEQFVAASPPRGLHMHCLGAGFSFKNVHPLIRKTASEMHVVW